MSFGGGGEGAPTGGGPPIPQRKVVGVHIPRLKIDVRHLLAELADFIVAGQTYDFRVPQGKYWLLLGGLIQRSECAAAITVSVYDQDRVQRRRLVVQTAQSAGTADMVDIPNNAIYKNNILKPIAEGEIIRCHLGADSTPYTGGTDPYFKISVVEVQAK